MTRARLAGIGLLAIWVGVSVHAPAAEYDDSTPGAAAPVVSPSGVPLPREASSVAEATPAIDRRRYERDLDAMRNYRPGYTFWHHVFTIPNGRMAFADAADGRLLATLPVSGDWTQEARWDEGSLAHLLAGRPLDRDGAVQLLEEVSGPLLYHSTRGSFIAEGTKLYGDFLAEWGAIFERFGVPAEIGLAQGLVESGLRGRIRSPAEAVGFCQWLPQNWARLQKLSPGVIEAYNQTTQVPYCAAHLAILATKYGSFIPALSEHHAGAVNVGRTLINGQFAGGDDIRDRYFLGAELTLLVRQIRPPGYREVVGGYGLRSFRYAEMVFGNAQTVAELRAAIPQGKIFAMRPDRALSLDEITRRTGLSVDELRRFNPALVNRVPAGANLYLPSNVEEFGRDTAFWHRPPSAAYTAVLREFMTLDERYTAEDWNTGSVVETLREFETRFRETHTEEGTVMAVVLGYINDELVAGQRKEILTTFRNNDDVVRLLELGVREREALLPSAGDSVGRALRNVLVTTASFVRP